MKDILDKIVKYREERGWTEYQLAAMETSTNCFFSNPAGKEARKNLESNFAPREKKKGVNK